MPLRFGTDGVRGLANVDLTPELALSLGRAAARVVSSETWLVGRDTRISGPMLQAAFSAGLAAEGAAATDVGVLPTPAIAHLAWRDDLPAAIISASHNSFEDNGVKVFGPGGHKLGDAHQDRLEAEVASLVSLPHDPERIGRLSVRNDGGDKYVEHLTRVVGERRLDAIRVVLDCANGAASELAPTVLRSVGADVSVLFNRPDGTNINAGCGSTHPEALQEAVLEEAAAVGLAFDGDADRVLAVDERGGLIDGDHLIALLAPDLREQGRLVADTVVVTVMSNLGLKRALEAADISVVETPVGDRAVLAALAEGGYSLGGEQSGHLIFSELSTTGDGILTGLLLVDLLARRTRPLGELAAEAMTPYPQVLRNVRVADASALEGASAVWAEVEAVQAELGEDGRVLVRASGTEPVVRVMAEAATHDAAEAAVARVGAAVERTLGSTSPRHS